MSAEHPKYDVAISFLYQDVRLARAIFDELSTGLEVFFFPRNQEELAGSDGLESMREPFRNESRLNVVLFRPRWGNTPWTAVEESAIKDSCLQTGFRSLFFIAAEPTTDFPKWLPDTHVRFNYADFGLEQAVGAIKARVQERGGHIRPLTPARKAEMLEAEEEFRRDRSYMLSLTAQIFKEVEGLFADICRECDEVDSRGHFQIQRRVNLQHGTVQQICTICQDQVSMTVTWYQPYGNSLDSAVLAVQEFDVPLILPPQYIHIGPPPEVLKKIEYLPDVSRTRQYGWLSKSRTAAFISTKDLARQLVIEFLDLIERDRTGKLTRNRAY